jgi:hypothetical protein
MKKNMFILAIVVLLSLLFKTFVYCQSISINENTNYKIYDDKGKKINAKIFKIDKNIENQTIKNEFIICFLDYDPIFRVHINLDGELIGTPEYGNRNFQIKDNILTIFNENLYYKNGLLYHPFLKGIDLDYNFYPDKLVFNSFGKIEDKSKYYTVKFP